MKSKWKNNANSLFLFFIDDLNNRWVDINNDGEIKPEEGWEYVGFDKNGAFNFLVKY